MADGRRELGPQVRGCRHKRIWDLLRGGCQFGREALVLPPEARSGTVFCAALGRKDDRMAEHTNNYPKLHNSTWPGVVGKGAPGAEPVIPLDTLLELTANADVDGVKYDGVDIWLADPHISIESSKDEVKRVADHIASYGLKIGSFVGPILDGGGGGAALGSAGGRERLVEEGEKGCQDGHA